MAYDKVVDSSVLDAGLKSIADAIRAKGGTSGNLAFPAAMAEAIAAIETGGGGASVQSGSFTPAENILEYTIPVDGTVSNFIMRKKTNSGGFGVRFLFGVEVLPIYGSQISIGSNSSGSTANSMSVTASPVTFGNGFVRIVSGASVSGLGYLVTEQYNWIAW